MFEGIRDWWKDSKASDVEQVNEAKIYNKDDLIVKLILKHINIKDYIDILPSVFSCQCDNWISNKTIKYGNHDYKVEITSSIGRDKLIFCNMFIINENIWIEKEKMSCFISDNLYEVIECLQEINLAMKTESEKRKQSIIKMNKCKQKIEEYLENTP